MSTPPTEEELLEVARAAARAAGDELLSRFGAEPIGVRSKSTPTDPVSAADLAAEEAIRAVLGRERPFDAILGEEGGATPGQAGAEVGSGLTWVVDPLDGTVNYLYGIPQFAVSVACEDGDGGLAGVVLDPVRGETFGVTRSGPALRGSACEELRGSACEELGHALVATGFGYDPAVREAQAAVASRVLPRARDLRRAGAAALDLAWCACGRLDAYWERGVKPWDIAAGTLLCARAGLVVRRLDPVPGGGDGSTELPAGILVAPPAIADELAALVADA